MPTEKEYEDLIFGWLVEAGVTSNSVLYVKDGVTVGIGTGCYSDPIEFMDLAPDLFVTLDDIVRTWTQTVYARDTGHPLVVVNHGASEEAGVRLLSAHLKKAYPEHKVVHYPQGCGYEWGTGPGGA